MLIIVPTIFFVFNRRSADQSTVWVRVSSDSSSAATIALSARVLSMYRSYQIKGILYLLNRRSPETSGSFSAWA